MLKNISRISLFVSLVSFLILPGCAETELAAHWVKKTITLEDDDTQNNNVSYAKAPVGTYAPDEYSGVTSKYGTQGSFKIGRPYKVMGVRYTPKESYTYDETGIASWYGPNFHGKHTANGEIYNQNAMTAAHKTLQMPSLVKVTNLENGRSVVLRINDRGPFAHGRIIDVSKRGAELLGFKNQGTARVRVQVLPVESKALAKAAKAGQPIEVAMNNLKSGQAHITPDRTLTAQRTMSDLPPAMPPKPAGDVSSQELGQPGDRTYPSEQTELARRHEFDSVPGYYSSGRFMPKDVYSKEAISDTSLYVQVGSFTMMENAESVQNALNDLATVVITQAIVNGTEFNRVRLGPLESVEIADQILERTINRGYTNAHIIVD